MFTLVTGCYGFIRKVKGIPAAYSPVSAMQICVSACGCGACGCGACTCVCVCVCLVYVCACVCVRI